MSTKQYIINCYFNPWYFHYDIIWLCLKYNVKQSNLWSSILYCNLFFLLKVSCSKIQEQQQIAIDGSLVQGCQIWAKDEPDWPQIGQIWDFVWLYYKCTEIWCGKSPGFVLFAAILTQLEPKSSLTQNFSKSKTRHKHYNK